MAEFLKTVIWLCTKLGKGLTERLLFRLFFLGGGGLDSRVFGQLTGIAVLTGLQNCGKWQRNS